MTDLATRHLQGDGELETDCRHATVVAIYENVNNVLWVIIKKDHLSFDMFNCINDEWMIDKKNIQIDNKNISK